MKKIAKYRYFSLILHAFVWSIVLFFPYFVSSADVRYKIGPLPGLYFTLSGVIHMIMFYTHNFYLYPKLLNRTYWWLYILMAISIILLSRGLKFYILAWWFPNDIPNAKAHVLFPSVMVFVVSILYSITVEKIRFEKLQKENEALQLGMELKFLRSQVSPHFLFNILTNLVFLARKKSDKLEESLLMLSGLMRYMLYDAGKKILLQQEVEYLESYVALQKLRFGRDIDIVFNIELPQAEKEYSIEPMMLIPFVENAFKHGTGYIDKAEINILLMLDREELHLNVLNRYDPQSLEVKDKASGIGLANVKRRLKLLYENAHQLSITGHNGWFNVFLTIKLTA